MAILMKRKSQTSIYYKHNPVDTIFIFIKRPSSFIG